MKKIFIGALLMTGVLVASERLDSVNLAALEQKLLSEMPKASIGQKLLGACTGAAIVGGIGAAGSALGMYMSKDAAGKSYISKNLSYGVAGSSAALGGLIGWFMVSSQEQKDFLAYKSLFSQWRQASLSPFVSYDLSLFGTYVQEQFRDSFSCTQALDRLLKVSLELDVLSHKIAEMMQRVNVQPGTWYLEFGKVLDLLCVVIERSKIDLGEHKKILEFHGASKYVYEVQQWVRDLLLKPEVVAAKVSLDHAIAYGRANMHDQYPLIAFVKELKQIVADACALVQSCVNHRDCYAALAVSDTRYIVFKNECDSVLSRLQGEFSLSLFEQRINEIYGSSAYQAEAVEKHHKEEMAAAEKRHRKEMAAAEKRHREEMAALAKIKKKKKVVGVTTPSTPQPDHNPEIDEPSAPDIND